MSVRGRVGARATTLASVLAVVATVLAVAAGWLAWTASAKAAAESVRVTAVGSPGCAVGRDVNDGRRVLVIATPRMRCYVDLEIVNYGDRSVRLDGVELFDIGTRAAAGNQILVAVEAGSGQPRMRHPEMGAASSPSTYDLAGDLEPGETYEAQVGLELNKDNCRGGANGLTPWPTVALSVGGTQHRIGPATSLEIRLAPSLPPDGPGCIDRG